MVGLARRWAEQAGGCRQAQASRQTKQSKRLERAWLAQCVRCRSPCIKKQLKLMQSVHCLMLRVWLVWNVI
jgi:hypothetical protein